MLANTEDKSKVVDLLMEETQVTAIVPNSQAVWSFFETSATQRHKENLSASRFGRKH